MFFAHNVFVFPHSRPLSKGEGWGQEVNVVASAGCLMMATTVFAGFGYLFKWFLAVFSFLCPLGQVSSGGFVLGAGIYITCSRYLYYLFPILLLPALGTSGGAIPPFRPPLCSFCTSLFRFGTTCGRGGYEELFHVVIYNICTGHILTGQVFHISVKSDGIVVIVKI